MSPQVAPGVEEALDELGRRARINDVRAVYRWGVERVELRERVTVGVRGAHRAGNRRSEERRPARAVEGGSEDRASEAQLKLGDLGPGRLAQGDFLGLGPGEVAERRRPGEPGDPCGDLDRGAGRQGLDEGHVRCGRQLRGPSHQPVSIGVRDAPAREARVRAIGEVGAIGASGVSVGEARKGRPPSGKPDRTAGRLEVGRS